jgi:arginyl-tRNA synthetase
MKDIISAIKEQAESVILNAITGAVGAGLLPHVDIPAIGIEKPRETNHGDLATNIAMTAARVFKKSPREIASLIVQNADCSNTYIDRFEIAGPGFINLFLKDTWLYDALEMVHKLGDKYGNLDYGKGEKVMVEYVSANPTGPLHMGNARGGALGDCIASVLQKAGYDVTREYYVNDAGNQITKFALSLELRYLQEINGENFIEFPEDCYQGDDIKEHVRNYIDEGNENLTEKESEYRQKVLKDYALPKNIQRIRDGLARYGIEYDVWFSEQSLYDSGELEATLDMLRENGSTLEYDGATWLRGSIMDSDKDEVLIKSDGSRTYFASDLAYHLNKFKTRNFDRVINLLGTDHHAHANRMKNAMPALDIDKDKLDLVLFQLVRLLRGGETVRMSKRTGKAVSLDDLLDETGRDAARFFFNMKTAGSHLDFDLDLAVSQSNENPVFYVQYAHARICSMLRILEKEGIETEFTKCPDLTLLKKDEEKTLIAILAEYPGEVLQAAKTLEPARLTRYVIDVASAFHSFYNACRVKGEEENLMNARILLVRATVSVIRNVLELIKINAPEKM